MSGAGYPPNRRTWFVDLVKCGTALILIWIVGFVTSPRETIRDTRRLHNELIEGWETSLSWNRPDEEDDENA